MIFEPLQERLKAAVAAALRYECAEDGLNVELKGFVCAGLRGEVTNALLDALSTASSTIAKANLLELLYYLHGTGGARFSDPAFPDPRPENAQVDQPITAVQFSQLIRLAESETADIVWGSYASLFDCIVTPWFQLSSPLAKRLVWLCNRWCREGDDYTRQRCANLIGRLPGGQPHE